MGTGRKKKKRPPPAPVVPGQEKVPKSFVIGRGKLPPPLKQLEKDLRRVMMPNTAVRLRESTKNTLKDFVHVAGPLGVTHFVILSATKEAPYLRIARAPRGPTLTFKVTGYSLSADILNAQTRPRAPPAIFTTPPLVVMNGLGSGEEHLKLVTVMFQNLFPPINVNTVKLAACQRVLLLNYTRDTGTFEVRHYAVSAAPTGVTRSIRKLVQRRALPDLSSFSDVSEFVTKGGYGSESEAEDEAAKVRVAQTFGRGNRAAQQSAVRLHEVGPRLSLQLLKVEEGLLTGTVMFHQFVKKSAEEVAQQKAKIEAREALRKQRKAEQEANVKRKQRLKTGGGGDDEEGDDNDDEDEEDEDEGEGGTQARERAEVEDDDDADWYRKEVGEEPDEGFLSGARPHYKSDYQKTRRPAGKESREGGKARPNAKGSKPKLVGERKRVLEKARYSMGRSAKRPRQ